MTRREQFRAIVKNNSQQLRLLGVKDIGLFGSARRGDDQADSDIDILVSFEPGMKSFQRFLDLLDFLEKELGTEVDLVTKEGLSPFIGPTILEEVEYVPIAS